jgi:hypothetical protein
MSQPYLEGSLLSNTDRAIAEKQVCKVDTVFGVFVAGKISVAEIS